MPAWGKPAPIVSKDKNSFDLGRAGSRRQPFVSVLRECEGLRMNEQTIDRPAHGREARRRSQPVYASPSARTTPGGCPMVRLNARLNAASEP